MSTMKMSWGSRIAVLYGGFVILIAILVIGSMRQSFDLVAPDYYGQEIKYQNVIDAGKNQSELSTAVALTTNTNSIVFQFPPELQGKTLSGTLHFYSPVNASWDKNFPLTVEKNTMTVNRSELRNTTYTVKMSWETEGKKYYQESELKLH